LVEQSKLEDKINPSTKIGLDLVENLRCSLEKSTEYVEEEVEEVKPKTNIESDSIDGLLKQLALRY
jgi:hypothetical protein